MQKKMSDTFPVCFCIRADSHFDVSNKAENKFSNRDIQEDLMCSRVQRILRSDFKIEKRHLLRVPFLEENLSSIYLAHLSIRFVFLETGCSLR